SARARGDRLRVDAQLVRVAGTGSNGPVAIAEEAGTPGALVSAIGRDLRQSLDVPAQEGATPGSESPAALAAFHNGTELMSRGELVLAEPVLERAVAADPAFGAAWYRLAETCEASGRHE